MNQTIGKKNKHKRTQTANKGNKGAKKNTKGNKINYLMKSAKGMDNPNKDYTWN